MKGNLIKDQNEQFALLPGCLVITRAILGAIEKQSKRAGSIPRSKCESIRSVSETFSTRTLLSNGWYL